MANLYQSCFMEHASKSIAIENIREFVNDLQPKRINFATSHKNALKKHKTESWWVINLPFIDSINPIIEAKLGADKGLYKSNGPFGGFWRKIDTEEEYSMFRNFVEQYKNIVFLRDHLDLSISLSMNFEDDKRTRIGDLEYLAKYYHDKNAERELVDICREWIKELPYYKLADFICAMPSSNRMQRSLPQRIVSSLNSPDFIDISNNVYWQSKTRSVKEASGVEEKIDILEESNIAISKELDINGKNIVLLDDLYMSGASMQYVAMKLKEAGARKVFGITLVKSRSNTTL